MMSVKGDGEELWLIRIDRPTDWLRASVANGDNNNRTARTTRRLDSAGCVNCIELARR